jgi:ABC-type nitrate/sulfonate/bicarbonate transport system permease component
MKRLAWAALSVAFFAALFMAWKLAADARLINPLWFPGPDRSFAKLGEWIATGALWSPLGQTVWRMFAGWLLACALGIAIGAAIASSPLAPSAQPSARIAGVSAALGWPSMPTSS